MKKTLSNLALILLLSVGLVSAMDFVSVERPHEIEELRPILFKEGTSNYDGCEPAERFKSIKITPSIYDAKERKNIPSMVIGEDHGCPTLNPEFTKLVSLYGTHNFNVGRLQHVEMTRQKLLSYRYVLTDDSVDTYDEIVEMTSKRVMRED